MENMLIIPKELRDRMQEDTAAHRLSVDRSRPGVVMTLAAHAGLLLGAVLLAGCAGGPDVAKGELEEAHLRAVVVTTTACGDAGATTGSGIIVDSRHVLVSAHVIAGSTSVSLAEGVVLEVVRHDTLRDLSLLRSPEDLLEIDEPSLAALEVGEDVVMVGGATSGDVEVRVEQRAMIDIDEVRGQRRSRRDGYRLAGLTARGDSGAGVYTRDGDLGGVIFATSTDDASRTWATASSEIRTFLDNSAVEGTFVCDPDQSERLRVGEP